LLAIFLKALLIRSEFKILMKMRTKQSTRQCRARRLLDQELTKMTTRINIRVRSMLNRRRIIALNKLKMANNNCRPTRMPKTKK
jgi:hypothetical protein